MKFIPHISVMAFTIATFLPSTLFAATSDTTAFSDAWKAHDVAKIEAAFALDAIYQDAVLRGGTGSAIAEYAATFKDATFVLERSTDTAENQVDLHWAITWPDARGTLHYVDHITLKDKKIEALTSESTDPVPPATLALVKTYYSTWSSADKPAIKALFGKNGSYMDRYVPGGASGDALDNVIKFHISFDTNLDEAGRVQWTKDGRIASDFEVFRKGSKSRVIRGRDLMRIQDGTFDEVIGVF
ncbi:MAG: nuclear transport factor 2 family protein [Pseudomonadota bacterium]